MPLILPGNVGSATAGGFNVDNSLRFNPGSSDYLNVTQSSGTSDIKGTFSAWIKGNHSNSIFSGHTDSNNRIALYFSDSLRIYGAISGSQSVYLITTQLFRDPNAWYHIVVAWDTNQGTDTNRFKVYVNGLQVTSFSTAAYPNQDVDVYWNKGTDITVGARYVSSVSDFFDGYMAETVLIDGLQLAPTSFGEFDSDSGIWKPIDVSGLTFGTNGFYLEFKQSGTSANASGMGADTSGNTNHFTVNNLTAVNQSIDTCINNFATLNPLKFIAGAFSEGNLKFTGIASNWKNRYSTIGVSSGKWFMEFKMGSVSNDESGVAIVSDITPDGNFPGIDSTRVPAIAYNSDGSKQVNNSASSGYFSAMATNDIIGIALDMDNGTVQFYRNGSTTGSAIDLSDGFSTSQYPLFFCGAVYGTRNIQANFGSPPYSESGGNSDGDGFGNFSMAVPSGYFALNTKNLAEYG